MRGVRVTGLLGALLSLALVSGCSSPERSTLTEAQFAERAAADTQVMQKTFSAAIERLLPRVAEEAANENESAPAFLDVLAMSGGGDFGAFGAGFLVGWGSCADPAWRRPDFDVVTGVSTGALLAPFAYVGTDEACLTVESFYRNPKLNWVEERGPLFFWPSNPSFMILRNLEADIRTAVNAELVEQMAAQAKAGKALIVSATDLDLGRQKFWDVGAEAEAAVASSDTDRVHRILMASAAIPAIFPPVEIDGELYADGGVTANVFVRLDPRLPYGMVQRWRAVHPDKPFPKTRYWIIINNQLAQAPKTTQLNWPSVMSPALATAIRSATIAEVRWLAAQTDFVNAFYHTDIELRVASIPDDWRAPAKGDFQKATMESLADLGRRMGADPSSWKVWASPKQLQR